ncbi:PH domain-containing protein [Sulfitobacter albidus]|uniref:PH domain-containing protein n=1 Tax=Sulfitobacter albidus TaxID=2829501 RepID=A0A975PPI9_9RHOB|nr:photosynthetic complex putative assembly protein PuhB [Sulfitobacter albidus]QUJ78380.1 PH domain-containing protein [Sulfitobacter albidus]
MHHDDFKFEPVRGLPEALPKDEHILWQGSPDPKRLAKDAWKMNWIMGYFVVLAIWRVGVSSADHPLSTAMGHGIPLLIAGAVACALVYVMALVQARATVYTLTNKRVAMRIGAALTMTLNLPYVCIANANAAIGKTGHGTIAFELSGETRISYLMSWPHVRPWHFARAEPALRAIPDAARVAAIFAEAAETRINQPQIVKLDPAQRAPGTVAAE